MNFTIKPHAPLAHQEVKTDFTHSRQSLVDKGLAAPGTTSATNQPVERAAQDAPPPPNDAKPDGDTPTTPELPESTRFAALAKREQQLRNQTKEIQAREEKIKAFEEQLKSGETLAQQLARSPLEALANAGVSIDDLLQKIANGPQPESETSKLEAKIQALEARLETGEKSQAEKQAQGYETAINQIRNDVKNLITGNEEYETIAALGQEEAVVELIKTTWEKEQRLLTTLEAAKDIEEQLLTEAMKLATVKKFKARLQPAEETSEAQTQATGSTELASKLIEQRAQRTLTNASASAQTPMSPMERARLAFKGQLPK